jgi:succinate dehydrogenase/fumarate reductase flavoprotein subunit
MFLLSGFAASRPFHRAQGGINAAKNYQNDGDSVFRLFYDTIKGGDFRSREANVYRLAEVSNLIIDQCTEQGVPFAREYGGLLANRSFGGSQVSRTFYARGQTGSATPARRLPGVMPPDRAWHRQNVSTNGNA